MQLRDLVRLQEVGNNKLKRKLSEVSRALEDEYDIAFELLTTGVLSDSARKDFATFQSQLAELGEKDDIVCSLMIVDQDEIKRRYDIALETDNPYINHSIPLNNIKHMYFEVAGSKVIVASLPLKECMRIQE